MFEVEVINNKKKKKAYFSKTLEFNDWLKDLSLFVKHISQLSI